MKGLRIDPDLGIIEVVEGDFGDYRKIQQIIECDTFTIAGYLNEHAVFCDDEGMLKLNLMFTKMSHYPYPLAGMILLLKATEDGDSTDATMTVEELQKEVQFMSLAQVKKQYGAK